MRRFSRSHKRFRRRTSPLFWIVLAAIALVILILRLAFFHTVRIEGSSMENSLRSGDIALVTCMTGEPQRGDIVECRFPGRSGTYVKRLIGLPGEHVEIKKSKLRGVESYGMICASSEIGLGDLLPASQEAEIVDLSAFDAPAGTPLAKALDLEDIILEIDNKSMTNRRPLGSLRHRPGTGRPVRPAPGRDSRLHRRKRR